MRILHRRVSVAVFTSQSLVSSIQAADKTRVLNFIDIDINGTLTMKHLDVRIEREVIGEGDEILLDLFCWSHKPERQTTCLVSDYRILPRPVWVLEEGELVEGGPDVAGRPRIGVVVPGAANLAGRLENGEGNPFLLQLRSNTESTEASTHNKGIVPLDPINFLSFGVTKPLEDGGKKQGGEKEADWEGEQPGKQGKPCHEEEEGECPVDEGSVDRVAHPPLTPSSLFASAPVIFPSYTRRML